MGFVAHKSLFLPLHQLFCVACMIWLMASSVCFGQNPTSKELIDLAVAGQQLNNSQIRTLSAEYGTCLEETGVPDDELPTKTVTRDKVVIKYKTAAKITQIEKCVFKGDKCRFELFAEGSPAPLSIY